MKILIISFFSWLVIAFLAGCGNKSNTEISEGKTFLLSENKIKVPEGWEREMPTEPLRLLQLNHKTNVDFKIAIFFFGEQNLNEANISRWKNQFSELKEFEKLDIHNQAVSAAIKITGTFKKKAFPMAKDFTEVPDYGTLAAIIPSADGPFYIKLSAPLTFINQEETQFTTMLNSIEKTN